MHTPAMFLQILIRYVRTPWSAVTERGGGTVLESPLPDGRSTMMKQPKRCGVIASHRCSMILATVILSVSGIHAAETTQEDLLRQGLFEEEANHDFDKAAERYRAVVAAHDKQRALAATATFRLGEIARKKNDREAAAAAFRTVVGRFPEQTDLARMSQENLAALGLAAPAPPAADPFASSSQKDSEEVEIERLKAIARSSPDLLDGAAENGWRPLHTAAAKGQEKVIAYLLENKADPNSLTTREQLTPLQIAAAQGRLGAVNALLAAGARVEELVPLA